MIRPLRHARKIALLFTFMTAWVVTACVNMPRNYVPAGFQSTAEVRPYLSFKLYFASKLTPAEWNAFYARFPEYFQDIHTAKQIGSTIEYHPWYVAYAFRWTTLQKRESWPKEMVSRLDQGRSIVGDDVFGLIYAKGPPARLIWDNDVEILLFSDDTAYVMASSKVSRKDKCPDCTQKSAPPNRPADLDWSKSTEEVLDILHVERPRY